MLELTEMIRELRRELIAAMADGSAQPMRFELGPVEVEATVAVSREAGGSGKVRFWVVEAGADGKHGQTTTHRITLTLQPRAVGVDGTTRTALISGDEVAGER
ncbi:trypco2 family protein [Streptomyces sp. NPDC093544]|uniref:trypco2 family protein n=1 Tax=Streptomyces sp. NPDC093544 TaxID=3155200 RepID=UPI0034249C43